MSASLIRRGLELLSGDIKDVSKAKKRKQQRRQQQTPSSASAMALVSTKRQGVTKQVKRLQGRLGPGKSKATVKDKRIKSAVEEFRKTQRKSQMSANLEYFMKSSFNTAYSDTAKIVNQNAGRQSRNRPDQPTKNAKEQQSTFSEEDFQQFQKEYFGRTVEEEK